MININGFEKQRRAAGLTQTETAKALNVAQNTVSTWESGTAYPMGNKLPAIARLYGCSIDDLFDSSESGPANGNSHPA